MMSIRLLIALALFFSIPNFSFARQNQTLDSTFTAQIVSLIYEDKYDEAQQRLDEVENFYNNKKPPHAYVKLLVDVGSAFTEKGDYGITLHYYFLALNFAVLEGYLDMEAEALIGVGYSYYFLEQLDKGLEYAERARLLAHRLGLSDLEATAYNLLGILHAKSKHDPQIVLDHYNQALAMRRQLGNTRGVASSLSNIALVKERSGNLEEALALQQRSLELDDSIGNEYGVAWSYQMIGDLLITMNRSIEANRYLTYAEERSRKLNAREIILQTYKSRSRLLSQDRKFEEALMYSNKYNTLRDSIYNAGLANKVSTLQQTFETRERDRMIAQQQAAIAWQKRLVIGGIITGSVILALLFFYYQSYNRSIKLNYDIVESNEEIQAQAEELSEANQSLMILNTQIAEQREELQAQAEELTESNQTILSLNEKLSSDIELKKDELFKTNQELVRHNSELLQFSFTVSHNLRGPVARMLGLMNLIAMDTPLKEKKQLIQLLNKATVELDVVIKDLGLIIDSRNTLSRIREKVFFQDEWTRCIFFLADNIKDNFSIATNFNDLPYTYSVRAAVQNIFYNLLSNAIRYQSPERKLSINVSTYVQDGDIVIELSDNGLGIDLTRHKYDIFKLYKRFHPHLPGKGIGLYLIKTQVESLGGKITLESELNRGTTFRIQLPPPSKIEEQILLETEGVKLYYDANINNTIIRWKRSVSGEEYRQVFETVLQTLRTYNTPGWIADLRNQGKIPEPDRKWFMEKVLPQAVECGLKRIGTVGFTDPVRTDYYTDMRELTNHLGVELHVFGELQEAIYWMESFMTSSQLVIDEHNSS
ncbi:MAG: tetratricopeptide repeat-containing sensor histidine kinase [Cyclobacteriaceae bacterium]|nr:tetratricopeptide repeat-containing sensor histidine kinase [Cyclobacteriaceae bacterium]